MPKYVTPDGEEYDVDTPDDPQVKAWIAENNAEPKALRLGKFIPAKIAEGVVKAPFIGSDLINLGLDAAQRGFNPQWMQTPEYQDFRQWHKGSQWIDEGANALGIPFMQPRNDEEKYIGAASGGLGGGLGVGGLQAYLKNATKETVKSALPMVTAQGITGGLGGQAGADVGGPVGGLVGGVIGGMAPFGLKPIPNMGPVKNPLKGPTQGEKLVSGAARTVPPQEFKNAFDNLDLMNRVGSKTFSLADLFPTNNQIHAIGDEMQVHPSGAPLTLRTAGREGDISAVTNRALDAVAPPNKSAVDVSLRTGEAAAARAQQMQDAKNIQFGRTLEKAPPVPYNMVEALRNELLNKAKQPNLEDATRAAYREMADSLLDPNQNVKSSGILVPGPNGTMVPKPDVLGLKTSPQTISSEINTRRQELTGPNAPSGKSIPTGAWMVAQKDFDNLFRKVVPEYGQAMSEAAMFNRGPRQEMRTSPITTLAPGGKDPDRPVPVTRLNSMITNQSGQDLRETLMDIDLGSQGRAGWNNPNNLSGAALRAALEQRIRKGTKDPAGALRGAAGSAEEATILDGIDFVGGNPKNFQESLIAAELLGRQRVPQNASPHMEEARMSALQAAVEPYGTGRRFIGKMNLNQAIEEASTLLGNPTKANLARIQELSRLYPEVRASVIRAGFGGMLAGQEQTREGK